MIDCDFCNMGTSGYGRDEFNCESDNGELEAIYIRINDDRFQEYPDVSHWLTVDSKRETDFNIKYCPMCGKRLERR